LHKSGERKMVKSEIVKETENLEAEAKSEIEVLVEQHNTLVAELQDANGRLAEVKQSIVDKQGYLRGILECQKQCEKGDK
jgi:uncharacterized protein involved in exopolysaccharide biosynthesis